MPIDYNSNGGPEDVHQLMNHNGWNMYMLNEIIPEDLCNHVINKLGTIEKFEDWDNLWWMPKSSEKFTVNSAWDIIRKSGDVNKDLRFV